MSPKYSGGSDEWLDDENEGGPGRGVTARAAVSQTAGFLPIAESNATVVEVFIGQCRARPDDGGPEVLSAYRRSSVLGSGGGTGRADVRERTPVAVGDRIKFSLSGPTQGVVEGLCARRNFLARHAAGRDTQQVIAANLDGLVVVASAHDPAFSPGLVDRYLVAASHAGIIPMLCLTKIDLLAPDAEHPWDLYSKLGMEVRLVSSTRNQGIEELRERLSKGSYAFCGQSGVGKTSLLAALLGKDAGRIGAVSSATHKGQHTTTHAVMLPSPSGAQWIDTPGVREFGLQGVTPETLRIHFPEFSTLPCSSGRCLHDGEPDCDAVGQVRLESYRRILGSLRLGQN